MISYDGSGEERDDGDTQENPEVAPTAEDAEIRMPPPPEATDEPPPAPEPAPLADGPYEYVHVACQSVAFRMPREPTSDLDIKTMTTRDGYISCNHCGAKIVSMHMRHVRPTQS